MCGTQVRCLQKKYWILTHTNAEQALKVKEFGAVLGA